MDAKKQAEPALKRASLGERYLAAAGSFVASALSCALQTLAWPHSTT